MKQVNELKVLWLCVTYGLKSFATSHLKTCSPDFLDIMYICHQTVHKKLGSLVGLSIDSKKRIKSWLHFVRFFIFLASQRRSLSDGNTQSILYVVKYEILACD